MKKLLSCAALMMAFALLLCACSKPSQIEHVEYGNLALASYSFDELMQKGIKTVQFDFPALYPPVDGETEEEAEQRQARQTAFNEFLGGALSREFSSRTDSNGNPRNGEVTVLVGTQGDYSSEDYPKDANGDPVFGIPTQVCDKPLVAPKEGDEDYFARVARIIADQLESNPDGFPFNVSEDSKGNVWITTTNPVTGETETTITFTNGTTVTFPFSSSTGTEATLTGTYPSTGTNPPTAPPTQRPTAAPTQSSTSTTRTTTTTAERPAESEPFGGAKVFDPDDYNGKWASADGQTTLSNAGSLMVMGNTVGKTLPVIARTLGNQKFYFQPAVYNGGDTMALKVFTIGSDGREKLYTTLYDYTGLGDQEFHIYLVPPDSEKTVYDSGSIRYSNVYHFELYVGGDKRYVATAGDPVTFSSEGNDGSYIYDSRTNNFKKLFNS